MLKKSTEEVSNPVLESKGSEKIGDSEPKSKDETCELKCEKEV